jgi:hypothetical protein
MRPRKRILLIDANRARHSLTRFVLRTHNYVVISAYSLAEADRIGKPEYLYLVLGFDIKRELPFAELSAACHVNSLIVRATNNPGKGYARVLCAPSMYDIVQTINHLAVRKRGPKIGTRKPPARVRMNDIAHVIHTSRQSAGRIAA